MFPDEGNRPARHVMNTSDLRGKTLIQLDVAACYNESYRRSLNAEQRVSTTGLISGRAHH
jgi:hypothetical protein